jgi:threonine dehydratase
MQERVTRESIAETERLIRPHIRRTPVVEIAGEDFGAPGVTLAFKLEPVQHAGAFKARGAFANLMLREVPPAGVAAASGGNHGAAVAYAAAKFNVPAAIFVPEIASPAKIARIESCGARLVVTGARYADALKACEDYVAETGALSVHAYDAVETMLGAGTLGLEFEAQTGGLDAVLVPVGGGGLIGGVSAWYGKRVSVVGVEPEACPTLRRALEAGRPVDVPVGGVAADSLGAKRIGAEAFRVAAPVVEKAVLVSDDAIRAAQHALWDKLRIVAEPGGATAFAGLLSGAWRPERGVRIGVIVSGANTTAVSFDLQVNPHWFSSTQ